MSQPDEILRLGIDVQHFSILRYLSIGFLALIWYDHILTLVQEIWLVWAATNSTTKYAMLIYRYGSLVGLTLVVYSISGSAHGVNMGFCRRLFPVISALGVIFNCFADFIALLHLTVLWRHDRRAIHALILIFTATTTSIVVCLCLSIIQAVDGIFYIPSLNVCASNLKPTILIVPWAVGLFFDTTALFFIALRSFQNKGSILKNCGTFYFVVSFSIRLFNLLATVALPLYLFGLIVTVAWPCFAINLSHLVFRLRSRQKFREVNDFSLQSLSEGLSQQPTLAAHPEEEMADPIIVDCKSQSHGCYDTLEMEMGMTSRSLDTTSEQHYALHYNQLSKRP